MPRSVELAISILSFLLILNVVIFYPAYILRKGPGAYSLLLEVIGLLILLGLIFKKRWSWKLSRVLAAVFAGLVLFFAIMLGRLGVDWLLFFGALEISTIVFLIALERPSAKAYFLNREDKK